MGNKWDICVQTGDWYDELFGGDKGADEAFRFIKSCGIDTLDYNIDHTLPGGLIRKGEHNDFYDADIAALLEYYRPIKEAADKNGVRFGQAHAPFPLYVSGCDELNEYLIMVIEKECAVCQYLGCPALVVHPDTNTADKALEREINLSMYRKMIPAGKKYGVKLCLENMFAHVEGHLVGGACAEATEAVWYIDTLNAEAGEDVFGYCFDVGHANLTARNVREELRILGHRLTILHIHDNDACSDLHTIPYFRGKNSHVDWEGVLAGLRDINYCGTLSFETFAALRGIPHELYPSFLRVVHDVGVYFQKRLAEG